MARSSAAAGLLILALAAPGAARAAEMCEACWEAGGRAGLMLPDGDSGLEPAASLGGLATFRFRPFWSVEFGVDRRRGSVEDGPDAALTLAEISFAYTFRSSREQRTYPFILFGAGVLREHLAGDRFRVTTPSGPTEVHAPARSDNSLFTVLGGGGITSVKGALWLRYEGRYREWSTFDISQSAFEAQVGLVWRLGG